jgi:CHASE3 domain sensor protein
MSTGASTDHTSGAAAGRGARSSPLLPPGTLFGFIVAVLAVALIAIFTYRSVMTQSIAATRVTQTLNAIQQLEALLSNLKDAETGQRGFLLTGEEPYLEPYTNGRAALSGAFATLRQQLADDPSQQRRTDALEQLAAERIAIIDETIVLRRAGNTAGALSLVRSDRGKAAMDRIRALVAEMETVERAVLGRDRMNGSRPSICPRA